MRIHTVRNVERFAARARSVATLPDAEVREIVAQVRRDGDAALRMYEKRFGGRIGRLRMSSAEMRRAYSKVPGRQLDAIAEARDRLAKVESKLLARLRRCVVKFGGITVSMEFAPVESAGCYIPGGFAQYPSSAVMSVTTAKVAGVERIVAVSPSSGGKIDATTAVAADLCGATEIYKVGGAHAIAAMAYGTRAIRPVDRIIGPGGPFVTAAKAVVSADVAVDMLAGPTELAVLADDSANAKYAAADIVAQAEHSADTFCCAITTSKRFAARLQQAVRNVARTAKRGDVIKASLKRSSFIAVCQNMEDATKLATILAPEHLQVLTDNPSEAASMVRTAGLVLLGNSTPSTASDYLLGSNHILPTGRHGRARGPLSVLDFMKLNTTVTSSTESLEKISEMVKALTDAEGLPNHYESVRCRV